MHFLAAGRYASSPLSDYPVSATPSYCVARAMPGTFIFSIPNVVAVTPDREPEFLGQLSQESGRRGGSESCAKERGARPLSCSARPRR
jgi:hypothetical protein